MVGVVIAAVKRVGGGPLHPEPERGQVDPPRQLGGPIPHRRLSACPYWVGAAGPEKPPPSGLPPTQIDPLEPVSVTDRPDLLTVEGTRADHGARCELKGAGSALRNLPKAAQTPGALRRRGRRFLLSAET
jgi:hypothetical protein